MSKRNLKIGYGSKVDGIIKIFEKESLVIQLISDFKKSVNIFFLCAIIIIPLCFVVDRMIGSIISTIFSLISILLLLGTLVKNSYKYTKIIQGKEPKCCFLNLNKIIDTIIYNLNLMRKNEWKILNSLLKDNNLYNIKSINILKEYFGNYKSKNNNEINSFIKKIIEVIVMPIIIGIIASYIYDKFLKNISIENISMDEMFDMLHIVVYVIIVSLIILIIYLFNKMKTFSIRDEYTVQRINKLLIDIILNKNKQKIRY